MKTHCICFAAMLFTLVINFHGAIASEATGLRGESRVPDEGVALRRTPNQRKGNQTKRELKGSKAAKSKKAGGTGTGGRGDGGIGSGTIDTDPSPIRAIGPNCNKGTIPNWHCCAKEDCSPGFCCSLSTNASLLKDHGVCLGTASIASSGSYCM